MAQLHVTSDLTFRVDGAGGQGADGRIEAEGPLIRVVTSDAARVWDAALGSSTTGPAALRFLAARLQESGLTVSVDGPDGTVATIGAGVSSRVGRVLAGSGQVSLGSPRAVAPLARTRLANETRRPVVRLVTLGALAVGVLVVARRIGSRLGK